jgi:hypothetical protein
MKGIVWSHFNIQKPNSSVTFPTLPKYRSLLPLKARKVPDFNTLMKVLLENGQKRLKKPFE